MRLNYQTTGPDDAPVLLLGSALGASHAMWAPQLDVLSERFRVIAFDHRGHGDSEAPDGPYAIEDLGGDVIELLNELLVERASYAGISLGGAIGLWLAENAPDRFHRFALLCPPAYPAAGAQMWTDRAAQVRAEGTKSITEATLSRWFLPEYADAHATEVDVIRQQLLATSDEAYASCCEALGAMDLRPALGDITAPVLLVTTDSDASVPPETVVELSAQIPGAHLELIEGSAHLVTYTHPDHINHLLLSHLT